MKNEEKDKKVIGIDLDEIIADFVRTFIDFYKEIYGRKILFEEIKTYNFWEQGLGKNREEAIKLVDEFYNSRYFDNIPLIDNARQAIGKLSLEKRVYIVTSRPNRFKEKTEEFVNNHFFGKEIRVIYSSDFHKENGNTKAEICTNLRISDFVEDNLEYARECAERGVRVFLYDKPWNQGKLNRGIIRVKSWQEILSVFGGT